MPEENAKRALDYYHKDSQHGPRKMVNDIVASMREDAIRRNHVLCVCYACCLPRVIKPREGGSPPSAEMYGTYDIPANPAERSLCGRARRCVFILPRE